MSLKGFFSASQHPQKIELDNVLDQIHFHRDFFSYLAHVKSGRYTHTSPSFEILTGYSVSLFETEGVDFYMKRVPPEDILNVMAKQAATFKEATLPGFDPELPNFIDMQSHFQLANGQSVFNFALATALSYLPNGEFEFALVGVYIQSKDTQRDQRVRDEMTVLLAKAKKLFRHVYPQAPFNKSDSPLTEIVFKLQPHHILTNKEKEVLQKIAQGLSTKEVATALGITSNTVETHRKKLLHKMEAKNVAELVKKASKLYWLD